MKFCANLKNDLIGSIGTKQISNTDIKNDSNNSLQNLGEYKNDLIQIVKDAEDLNKSDDYLIDYLNNLNIQDDLKPRLKHFCSGYDDFSLLHIASKYCRKKFCAHLINLFNFDKDILTKSKLTPLQTLIKYNVIEKETESLRNDPIYLQKKSNLIETFKFFIENQANVNHQDENGFSPLHYAALKNNYEIIVQLVQMKGIKIFLEDKKSMTALHIALKFDCNDVANFLLDYTNAEKLACYKVPNAVLPVHIACRSKTEKLELIKKILNKLRSESNSDRNYLEYVLRKEDYNRQTLVHIAINNNHLKIVELLYKEFQLDKEIKEGKLGNLAVHASAKNGSIALLEILEKNDAMSFGLNNNLDNALHIAAENNATKFIKEFLDFEKNLINRVETDRNYLCACICDLDSHILSVRVKNKRNFTPLMTALAYGNHKCIEEILFHSKDVELDTKDLDGNTIYHLCAQFNNLDSLKFFLQKFFTKTSEVLYLRNSNDETVFHVACRFGYVEVIKMVLQKIYDSNVSVDTLLYSQNMLGQTCFHLACVRGFYNIVEFFLRDKKLTTFLEHIDNTSNTCLHMATQSGHATIVTLLLDHGADIDAKNEENLTALDLSCRLGYFEISKTIIHKYSKMSESHTALHTAAQEGAHEVVKLLLLKGAVIDKLNDYRQNCLDLAILRGQNEVVKVLLSDKSWNKLIRFNNYDDCCSDEDAQSLSVITETEQNESNEKKIDIKYIENPQLQAMFENKMWDSIKLVLDRCVEDDNKIDFTKIDMPVESISKHPLMLIARSGQENLLKHHTVTMLLNLKWRLIPRSAFYLSILFYLFFLVLLSLYSIELANAGTDFYNEFYQDKDNSTMSKEREPINLNDFDEQLIYHTNNSVLFYLLLITVVICLVKEAFQLLILDGFSYIFYLQNIIEIATYVLALISLFSTDYIIKSGYGSISILLAFLVFPLHIQKLKIFGVYVVAFCRTLMNSAKFFPIFLIIYIGFLLSFKIRSNFGVSYFESTLFSLVRTLTMVTGELDSVKMGLTATLDSLPNYIIYVLFIGLMCTILINLFVGIAVGEIKTVLDEADIQQISMRIIFVLKVQLALHPFRNTCVGKYLNMSFKRHDFNEQNSMFKFFLKEWKAFVKLFSSKEPEINLMDPQKRLEDSLLEMSKNTSEQIKSIKSLFNNQVSDVETKLNNSQTRVEDGINEMARNSTTNMETLVEQMNLNSKNLITKLDLTETKLDKSIEKMSIRFLDELNYSKAFFDDKLNNIEIKLDGLINESFRNTNSNLDTFNANLNKRFAEMENIFLHSERILYNSIKDTSDAVNKELYDLKSISIGSIRSQLSHFEVALKVVRDEIYNLRQSIDEREKQDKKGPSDQFYFQP